MLAVGTLTFQRDVIPAKKQVRVRLPKSQSSPGKVGLAPAILYVVGELTGKAAQAIRILRSPTELIENPRSLRVIHGPAIVGIHQAEFPKLVALIDVRYARRGELYHRLRKAVEHPKMRDHALKGHKRFAE